MAYKIIKVKRQTGCASCGVKINVRKHMLVCGEFVYCLNCGDKYLDSHREQFKKMISEINKAFRTIRRYDKERVLLKLTK